MLLLPHARSFGFAAQSLLAALGSVQFVSNMIFASLVLKEKVGRAASGHDVPERRHLD